MFSKRGSFQFLKSRLRLCYVTLVYVKTRAFKKVLAVQTFLGFFKHSQGLPITYMISL